MNVPDILKRLGTDDAQLELSLRGGNLNTEHKALIRDNRDALLEYLAGEFAAAKTSRVTHLDNANVNRGLQTDGENYAHVRNSSLRRDNVSEPIQTDAPDMAHESNYQRAGNLRNTATLPTSAKTGVTLCGDLLLNLMVWVHRYHELNLEHPGGVIRNARPEHAAHHLQTSAWCVVFDETKTILATAGAVSRHALAEKTELQTTQPAETTTNPVTAEKVVN